MFVRPFAALEKRTVTTVRTSGRARIAAMEDQEVVGVLQVFGGYRREQGLFDGQRGFAGSNTYPVAYPEDMGIHRNGGVPELGIEDDVGGFTPDTGERFQRLPVCGHFAVMQGQQLLRQGMHMTGLGVE